MKPGLREYNRAQRALRLVVSTPAAKPPTRRASLRSICAHCVERRPICRVQDGDREVHLCGACWRPEGVPAFVPGRTWTQGLA